MKLGTTAVGAAPAGVFERLGKARDGLAIAAVVGIAATYLSAQLKLSAMVFALLFGMALNFLSRDEHCRPGIEMASRIVLRTGVALLGLRITVAEVAALGWSNVALVIAALGLTIGFGVRAARRLRLGDDFGILSGGAVAICGASAALAISTVLPKHDGSQRDATFVVISVTALSTVAMIAYPFLADIAGLDHRAAGVFFGGTIHDVAQVVGAGYSVSEEAGDTATIVKLLRVAMLLPVCMVIGMVLQVRGGKATRSVPVLPGFVVVFGILVLVTSAGWLPEPVVQAGTSVSGWLLVTAMAAIGMKTSLRSLAQVGPKAVMLVVIETLFIGVLVLGALAWSAGA